jgi:hypothetical protein
VYKRENAWIWRDEHADSSMATVASWKKVTPGWPEVSGINGCIKQSLSWHRVLPESCVHFLPLTSSASLVLAYLSRYLKHYLVELKPRGPKLAADITTACGHREP